MTVIAYKWGGISFDDNSLIRVLVLPSDADDAAPITFHLDGVDYQVPGGKVFMPGKVMAKIQSTLLPSRIGESDAADGAITKEVIFISTLVTADRWQELDVLGLYSAGKYVTAQTTDTTQLRQYTTLYGVEIDAQEI